MRHGRRILGMVLAVLVLGAGSAGAQVFGTFAWQMQPYCNVVTLTITQIPGGYTIDGNDNQCGAAKLAGAAGMALVNPDGTVGLEFTIVTAPSGKAVHVSASLNPATGSGTWTDSVGNTGNFALGSPGSGSPRPLPASGLGAATVTTVELAPAAVGNAQLAPNAVTGATVADGSLTMLDVANGPRLVAAANTAEQSLSTTDAVYSSISITAPAAGKVLVNANGYFRFDDTTTTTEFPRCSITTGTAVESNFLIISSDGSSTTLQYDAWAATRVFTVAAAGPITINLACNVFTATATKVGRPQLTALFVAQ